MIFSKRFSKSHLKFVSDIYRFLIQAPDKYWFTLLFNFKSLMILSPSRLGWNGHNFIVTDKEFDCFQYEIRHQAQCDYAYRNGVRKRAQSLANCYFLNEIDWKDGDILLDCGANVGDLKIWFDLNNIAIEYIGFEPSPVEFACLQKNVKPSVVHNVALWKKTGNFEFFLSSQRADSSLIRPKHFESRIMVPATTLASYVSSKVKVVKIEVEGAEPEVLEGLGSKLKLVEYIVADLGYERGVNCESTLVPVTDFLLDRGFERVKIYYPRLCALFKNKCFEATT